MLGITQRDRKWNEWVRLQMKVTYIIKRVKKLKWHLGGLIARGTDDCWTNEIIEWSPRDVKQSNQRPNRG